MNWGNNYYKIKHPKIGWKFVIKHPIRENVWLECDKQGYSKDHIILGKPEKIKKMKISKRYGWLIPFETKVEE